MLKISTVGNQDAVPPVMDVPTLFPSLRLQRWPIAADGSMLQQIASRILVLPLAVTIRLDADCALDSYKGSTFHGGLGRALAQVAPLMAARLYLESDDQASKPFALEPPLTERTDVKAGELLQFRLTIFGDAVDGVGELVAALKRWGTNGLGPQRAPFTLVDIAVRQAIGPAISLSPRSLSRAAGMAKSVAQLATAANGSQILPDAVNSLVVTAETRLRIQHRGELLRAAPAPEVLMSAVGQRLLAVAAVAGVTELPTLRELLGNRDVVTDCHLSADYTHYADWQRYSLRDECHVPLGGVVGAWVYEGKVAPLLPWLAVGQWLQLGNKTTFGFGRFSYSPGY